MDNENNNSGIIGGLLGGSDISATIKVKLDEEQYIYLALAVIVGVLLGTLFGDIFKKMLGTT